MWKEGRREKWSDRQEMSGKKHGLTLLNMGMMRDVWGSQHQTMNWTSFSCSTVSVKSLSWAYAKANFCERKMINPGISFKCDVTPGHKQYN